MDVVSRVLEIGSILGEYLAAFPDERERLAQLQELVRNSPNEEALVSRKTFVGHVTVSGLVISRSTRKVLLLQHKIYRLYLQPGGHVRAHDRSMLEAARRRVEEETSITSLEHVPFHFNHDVPIDIDTHHIPESKVRAESTHWHHDFRYVFLTDAAEAGVVVKRDKFVDHKWEDINELMRMGTYLRLAGKIQTALSAAFRPKIFFERVLERLDVRERSNAIVVSHLLPDAEVYLRALDKVSRILAVIPKPKSKVLSVHD